LRVGGSETNHVLKKVRRRHGGGEEVLDVLHGAHAENGLPGVVKEHAVGGEEEASPLYAEEAYAHEEGVGPTMLYLSVKGSVLGGRLHCDARLRRVGAEGIGGAREAGADFVGRVVRKAVGEPGGLSGPGSAAASDSQKSNADAECEQAQWSV
jgi:hypothetical protein